MDRVLFYLFKICIKFIIRGSELLSFSSLLLSFEYFVKPVIQALIFCHDFAG